MLESISSMNLSSTTKHEDNKVLDFSMYKIANDIITSNRKSELNEQENDLSYLSNNNLLDNAYLPDNNFIHYPKKQYEISGDIDNLDKKQKLKSYGILANLAYSDLKPVNKGGVEKLEVANVNLDVLSFPNINKIFDTPKPSNLTTEEESLYAYIQENMNNDLNTGEEIYIVDDIRDILRLTNFQDGLIDDGIRYVSGSHIQSDIGLFNTYGESKIVSIKQKNNTLIRGLNRIKSQKLKENRNILEQLEGEFKVLDYFPKDLDNNDSGFGAMFLEDKNGKKYISIRGTELTDWGDLVADKDLFFNQIPEAQTKDMVDFVKDKFKQLGPEEKIRVIGHSLGGALSQILTSMYTDQVDETYTFNSPGAMNLKHSLDSSNSEDSQYVDIFNKFMYNKSKGATGDLITNVAGTGGLNIIRNLGVDIGNYEILLKGLWMHSIVDTVNYIDELKENSEELEGKRVKEKLYIDDNNKERD